MFQGANPHKRKIGDHIEHEKDVLQGLELEINLFKWIDVLVKAFRQKFEDNSENEDNKSLCNFQGSISETTKKQAKAIIGSVAFSIQASFSRHLKNTKKNSAIHFWEVSKGWCLLKILK